MGGEEGEVNMRVFEAVPPRSDSLLPRQDLRILIKSQFLKIWIPFGDKCPRNDFKNVGRTD